MFWKTSEDRKKMLADNYETKAITFSFISLLALFFRSIKEHLYQERLNIKGLLLMDLDQWGHFFFFANKCPVCLGEQQKELRGINKNDILINLSWWDTELALGQPVFWRP